MKLSYVTTYLFVYALALGVLACSSEAVKPSDPVPTTEAPATTLAPTTTLAPVSCATPGPGSYKCYDWGPCGGVVYSREEAIALLAAKDPGGCNKLDDEPVKGGFGPCSQCISFKPANKAMMYMSAPMAPARLQH